MEAIAVNNVNGNRMPRVDIKEMAYYKALRHYPTVIMKIAPSNDGQRLWVSAPYWLTPEFWLEFGALVYWYYASIEAGRIPMPDAEEKENFKRY